MAYEDLHKAAGELASARNNVNALEAAMNSAHTAWNTAAESPALKNAVEASRAAWHSARDALEQLEKNFRDVCEDIVADHAQKQALPAQHTPAPEPVVPPGAKPTPSPVRQIEPGAGTETVEQPDA